MSGTEHGEATRALHDLLMKAPDAQYDAEGTGMWWCTIDGCDGSDHGLADYILAAIVAGKVPGIHEKASLSDNEERLVLALLELNSLRADLADTTNALLAERDERNKLGAEHADFINAAQAVTAERDALRKDLASALESLRGMRGLLDRAGKAGIAHSHHCSMLAGVMDKPKCRCGVDDLIEEMNKAITATSGGDAQEVKPCKHEYEQIGSQLVCVHCQDGWKP